MAVLLVKIFFKKIKSRFGFILGNLLYYFKNRHKIAYFLVLFWKSELFALENKENVVSFFITDCEVVDIIVHILFSIRHAIHFEYMLQITNTNVFFQFAWAVTIIITK